MASVESSSPLPNNTASSAFYNFISTECWTAAIRNLKRNPKLASEWIYKTGINDQTGKKEEYRVLPIHTACALNPSFTFIKALLDAYPEGASFADNQGLYPLHYACGNFASADVIESLCTSYPEAIKLADPNGMLPLHHMTLWGVSSEKSLDILIRHCDKKVYLTKDIDGSTPLDLAFVSEENEFEDYIIEKLEVMYDDGISVEEEVNNSNENILRDKMINVHINSERDKDEKNLDRDIKAVNKIDSSIISSETIHFNVEQKSPTNSLENDDNKSLSSNEVKEINSHSSAHSKIININVNSQDVDSSSQGFNEDHTNKEERENLDEEESVQCNDNNAPPKSIKINASSNSSACNEELTFQKSPSNHCPRSPRHTYSRNKRSSSRSSCVNAEGMKVNNTTQNQLDIMAQVCAQYKNEKERLQLSCNALKREVVNLQSKFKVVEKETKMIQYYKSENKTLEHNLKTLQKVCDEYKRKAELAEKEQDMLDCYKSQNRSLESRLFTVEKDFADITDKAMKLEKDNCIMADRLHTFQSLSQLIFNTIKAVNEKEESYKKTNEGENASSDNDNEGIQPQNSAVMLNIPKQCSMTAETSLESMLDMDLDICES